MTAQRDESADTVEEQIQDRRASSFGNTLDMMFIYDDSQVMGGITDFDEE